MNRQGRECIRGSARQMAAWVAMAVAALAGCGGGGEGAAPGSAGSVAAPVVEELPEAVAGPTYYFSDCQAGASVACVAGDNAHNGTSAATPKRNLSGFDVNALPAGSRVLFARGGAWANFNVSLQNGNATPTSPLVFDSYAPAWGGTAQPWLRAGGTFYAFQFGAYNDMSLDGGYIVRNLKVDGDGVAGAWGFFVRNNTRNVTISGNEITGFELGIHSGNTEQPGVGNVALTIRNNNVHHNSEMGMLGDANDMLIEGNTFADNNFSGSSFNHAIYLGGHARNGIVRNNTFTNNSVLNGVCTGGNFTVHGQWDGLLVEGNTIQQVASGGGCYGISINSAYDSAEWFRNLVVRGNTIVNLGYCAVCLTSAPGAIVENNLIVNTQATYQAGILIPDRTPGPGDDLDSGAIIRNNTLYFSHASAWSEGLQLRTTTGSNLQVVSNVVYFGAASAPTAYCFRHPPLSHFVAFDNNLCHHASGAGTWGATLATLADARLAGFDAHGQSADPLFVALPSAANGWSDQIQPGSPARAAGHATRSSRADRLGVVWATAPNIGAR